MSIPHVLIACLLLDCPLCSRFSQKPDWAIRQDTEPGGSPNTQFVRYVRGNPDYGENDFVDNGDGTVTDKASGLVWQKVDDGKTRDWEEALACAENLKLADHEDWRLPNAKELQSIVDYTRAPDAAKAARRGPAIDAEFFDITEDESYFWTNTTLPEAKPFTLLSDRHSDADLKGMKSVSIIMFVSCAGVAQTIKFLEVRIMRHSA